MQDKDTGTLFVISMREDFALELDSFRDHLSSTFLFENIYRLEKLPLAEAKRAIVEPLEHVGHRYEPGLLDERIGGLNSRSDTASTPGKVGRPASNRQTSFHA